MSWKCNKNMWLYIYMYIYTHAKNERTRIPYLCKIRVHVKKTYVYVSCTMTMVLECSSWQRCNLRLYAKKCKYDMLCIQVWNSCYESKYDIHVMNPKYDMLWISSTIHEMFCKYDMLWNTKYGMTRLSSMICMLQEFSWTRYDVAWCIGPKRGCQLTILGIAPRNGTDRRSIETGQYP